MFEGIINGNIDILVVKIMFVSIKFDVINVIVGFCNLDNIIVSVVIMNVKVGNSMVNGIFV